jgi:hypothetical protein
VVRFNRSGFQQTKQATLLSVVTAELTTHQSQLRKQQVTVDLDVDPQVGATPCSQRCADLIRQLMRMAISRSPARGEIDISACRTVRGIELEIADSGTQSPVPQTNAFNRCDPVELQQSGAESASIQPDAGNWDVYCMRCPQGGYAWSIVMQTPRAAVRAA